MANKEIKQFYIDGTPILPEPLIINGETDAAGGKRAYDACASYPARGKDIIYIDSEHYYVTYEFYWADNSLHVLSNFGEITILSTGEIQVPS